jgi:histidyl-tRNA synthetase
VYKAPRGTIDILPEEQPYWHHAQAKAFELCGLYGYQRLDTPVFEDYSLFVRSVGEGTDIVTKEMYAFKDKGDNELTLRPEGTAPVCRAYLEHGMFNQPQPVKLYYVATIFRYERPQAGRYRQHSQFGFEAIGDADPALDAEVIDMATRLYRSIGIDKITLKLNSIGCRICRPGYIADLKEYYSGYLASVCPDCQLRFPRNPLRLLDCKRETCMPITDAAPKSVDHLCPECRDHFGKVQDYLKSASIPYHLDHRLVRGLDYYTKTVFEVQPADAAGAQSALGGGGRYDDLISQLGGNPTPAIGFAAGLNRIVNILMKEKLPVPPVPQPTVFLAHMGEEARLKAFEVAATLRQAGIGVVEAFGEKSLKAQMRQANGLNSRHVVILGEEEVRSGLATLKHMVTGDQTKVPIDNLEKVIGADHG